MRADRSKAVDANKVGDGAIDVIAPERPTIEKSFDI